MKEYTRIALERAPKKKKKTKQEKKSSRQAKREENMIDRILLWQKWGKRNHKLPGPEKAAEFLDKLPAIKDVVFIKSVLQEDELRRLEITCRDLQQALFAVDYNWAAPATLQISTVSSCYVPESGCLRPSGAAS